MSDELPDLRAAQRRGRMVLLLAVALVLLAIAGLALRGHDVKGALEQGMNLVRSAGPTVYFTAMAILPAFGAPQSAFTLTAGPLFGPQLGTTLVVTLAMLAMLVNFALSYWLAGRVLRPVLEVFFKKMGYKIPQPQSGDETDLIVLLRVTPGIPFPVQNYLLGLARVNFFRYLLVSFLIQGPINAAVVIFGDALLKGKGGMAFLGISLIIVLLVGTHLVRKHYGKKRA
jgi:uncharacterized membrane protein YdjX (TVP38/TMEM64 family)